MSKKNMNNTAANGKAAQKHHSPDINQIVDTVVNVCLGKITAEQAIQELALEFKDEAIFLAKENAF